MDREAYLQIHRPANECVLCGASLIESGRHPSVLEDPEEAEGAAAKADAAKTDAAKTAAPKTDAAKGKSKAEARAEAKARLDDAKTRGEASRKDFCSTCWENLADHRYFSYWLVKRTKPEANRKLAKAERNEVLWRLFAALAGRGDEQTEVHVFLLAHLLMKYGLLKWRANHRTPDDANWIVFEHPRTNEEFRVREHSLDDDALVRTLQEIEDLVGKEVSPDLAGAIKF